MSGPLILAMIVLVLGNVVGLASSRTWLRFVGFYLVNLAIFVGVSAAIVLPARYVGDQWEGQPPFFGYQVDDAGRGVIVLGALWFLLLAVLAIIVFVFTKIPQSASNDTSSERTSEHEDNNTPTTGRPWLVVCAGLLAGAGWFFDGGHWLIGAACLSVVGMWLARVMHARRGNVKHS